MTQFLTSSNVLTAAILAVAAHAAAFALALQYAI
jgi:hypothetical protein